MPKRHRNRRRGAPAAKRPKCAVNEDPLSDVTAEAQSEPDIDPSAISSIGPSANSSADSSADSIAVGCDGDKLVALTRQLLDALECPVCLDLLEGPVKTCASGHAVCLRCVKCGLTQCPLCSARFMASTGHCVINKVINLVRANRLPAIVEELDDRNRN